jgi:hypothetical protein
MEAGGAGQMAVKHRDHLAPRGKGAGLDAVRPGQLDGDMSRNVLANLTEDAYDGLGWFVFIFHSCCVTGPKKLYQPFFLWDASG